MRKIVLFSLISMIILLTGAFTSLKDVSAAACGTGSMMPSIDTVQPSQINNSVPNTITVTGNNFEDRAIVLLDGYGALPTECVNTTVLTASAPAGIPGSLTGRSYTVRVINPTDSATNQAARSNAITVYQNPAVTAEPAMTSTPVPTDFVRPLLTVFSYGASSTALQSNQNIDFEMTLQNLGAVNATNVVVTFTAGDLIPRATGGVVALGTIPAGGRNRFFQPFTTGDLGGKTIANLEVSVRYTTTTGDEYTDTFTLTFPVVTQSSGGTGGPTATPTLVPGNRPQLVIDSYTSSEEPLLPGVTFDLTLSLRNLGSAGAEDVVMIVGGGTVSDGGEGTPGPGGVAGGGGDFGEFAPLGTSNVQYLGDLPSGGTVSPTQSLVVNVTTEPGAYPMKVSFIYTGPNNTRYTDEQVVTLLVFTSVNVEASFYFEPGPFFVGEPGALPIQINNLGRKGVVFGNLEVQAEGAEVTNNTVLVGLLDSGGFFTTDAMLVPTQPGMQEITLILHYTDDFNQPQQIVRTLSVEVMDAPVYEEPDPGMNGGMEEIPMETFFQKLWRFIRGLLGLDSVSPSDGMIQEMPVMEEEMNVAPAPRKG